MKVAIAIFLGAFLVFLAVNVVAFSGKERTVAARLKDLQAQADKARAEEASLKDTYTYLANPVNLEKELRARFNFKGAGEKTLIIVPSTTTPQ